uniref:Uncharacterized protein n=1 Tax=Pyxicephalus adspersus TaxID=30357 RepID=A0AAV2ZNE2_PYXAD|nr:TPA: hypothetical protein GDO54_016336 [Pyxicephalus adspersus]
MIDCRKKYHKLYHVHVISEVIFELFDWVACFKTKTLIARSLVITRGPPNQATCYPILLYCALALSLVHKWTYGQILRGVVY